MGQVTASTNGLLPQWSSICDTLIFTVLAHSAEPVTEGRGVKCVAQEQLVTKVVLV